VSAVALLLLVGVTVAGPRDTTSTTPVYRLSGAARYVCAFDAAPLHRCAARFSIHLEPGGHVLRVQGIDRRGRRTRPATVRIVVRLPVTGGDLHAVGDPAPTMKTGSRPFGVAAAAGSIWTADFGAGTVTRLDPVTGAVLAMVRVGGTPSFLAVGEGSLWVGNDSDPAVTRIDPTTGLVVARIPAGPRPTDLAIGSGAIWVCNYTVGTVTRIDPATNRAVATIRIGGSPNSIAASDDAVYAGEQQDNTLVRIDPATNRVSGRVPTDDDPDYLLVDGDSLWASAYRGGTVTRFDAATLRPTARIRVPGAEGMVVDGGSLWVGSYDENQVVRVDPVAGRAVAAYRTGAGVRQVDAAFGRIWTADSTADTVSHIPVARARRLPSNTVLLGGGSGWIDRGNGRRSRASPGERLTNERQHSQGGAPGGTSGSPTPST
jgi:YVTN family beta-propeller protein